MEHHPVACTIVDNLEVACLYHYHLQLTLSDDKLEGEAVDLTRNAAGEECLRLKCVQALRDIPLRQIMTIEAKTQNPYFSMLKPNESRTCQ